MRNSTILPLLTFIVLLGSVPVAFAQSSDCTVSGTVYRASGVPAANETLSVLKVEQNGTQLQFAPFDVQADGNGFVSFSVPRNSVTWVRASNVTGLNNFEGVPLSVPDADTAALETIWQLSDGVSTFNGRAGDVFLTQNDIISGLGYTPANEQAVVFSSGTPGGQTIAGGTDTGQALRLTSTISPVKGNILFGNSVYDEADDRLGIGTASPADSIETTGHIRVGVEKGVRFQTQGTPFSLHVASTVFNGTRDDGLFLAYNLLPGTTTTKVNPNEPQLKFAIEANYNPGNHTQMEWNFDYLSADGTVLKRPLAFAIDRATHMADWTFSQRSFTIADNNGVGYARFDSTNGLSLTSGGLGFWGVRLDRRANSPGHNMYPAFRPTTLNTKIELGVMPNGSPVGNGSASFSLWKTDYRLDQSNYERLVTYARNDAYYVQSEGAGSGIARPIVFQNNALVITPGGQRVAIGTNAPNSTFQVNGSFATSIVAKKSNYTATEADAVILGDATAGSLQINLPTAVGIAGRQYVIKKVDRSSNSVRVMAGNNQTIDGNSAVGLSVPFQVLRVVSDGSNWFLL